MPSIFKKGKWYLVFEKWFGFSSLYVICKTAARRNIDIFLTFEDTLCCWGIILDLCITGLTELLGFVWGLFGFGFFTVKNPSLARKILLRVIVAGQQLAPWSPRNNSKLIPCNWEQKRLFSFWLSAEPTELVISAEVRAPCTHHPSVFTQQLLIFY